MKKPSLLILTLAILVFTSLACGSSDDDDDSGTTDTDTDTDIDSDTDTDTETETDTGIDFQDEHFNINVTLSPAIGTVAIVTWSTDYETFDSAQIEFGLNTDYDFAAPVDLNEPENRTLLLGMKPDREYHFRIVLNDGGTSYQSEDFAFTTGQVANGLPVITVDTVEPSALQGGFTVFSFYEWCRIMIMDEDGEYVWWYSNTMTRCSRARMSYDGKHMIFRNVNVGGEPNETTHGKIVKVSMDGLVEETVREGRGHHDFTVLPDGTIAFIAYDGENCDDINEIDGDGNEKLVFHIADAVSPAPFWDGCHSNSILHWPEDDTYTVSVLENNQIIKFTRDGELVWVFGGDENDFSGDLSWQRQHGHHLYDGNLLFFNNGEIDWPAESRALIYSIDETNLTAELIWDYSSGYSSMTFGDVQHLSGGNILVTFSNDGVIHEVDPGGDLVQAIHWNLGGATGYSIRRDSLYGPPPK